MNRWKARTPEREKTKPPRKGYARWKVANNHIPLCHLLLSASMIQLQKGQTWVSSTTLTFVLPLPLPRAPSHALCAPPNSDSLRPGYMCKLSSTKSKPNPRRPAPTHYQSQREKINSLSTEYGNSTRHFLPGDLALSGLGWAHLWGTFQMHLSTQNFLVRIYNHIHIIVVVVVK